MDFYTSLSKLSGIGPKRAEAFASIGLYTVGDLLYHFPRAYQNRGNISLIAAAPSKLVSAFVLEVMSAPSNIRVKGGRIITKFRAFDESGVCTVVYFNQPYLKNNIYIGKKYRFFGALVRGRAGTELISPVCEPFSDGADLSDYVPIYKSGAALSQKLISQCVEKALDECRKSPEGFLLPDPLSYEIRRRYGLCDLIYALENIHFPASPEVVETARKRLMFDELYLFGLKNRLSGRTERSDAVKLSEPDFDTFASLFPFSFTNAQRRTMKEIRTDMTSGKRMNRLVTGDVGSGKTACAAYAVYIAVGNGMQAVIMAPTEILARQHFEDLEPLFTKLGKRTVLLIGATKAGDKKRYKEGLADGTIDIVIGTHALIEDSVTFFRLGVAVIDEQHRFGVKQRAALFDKSSECHTLTMSATPIPRTLAMSLFGTMSASAVDEIPPGRQKTDTYVVDESYRARLDGFIRKQVAEGGQVYIVCPAVEEQEDYLDDSGEKISQNNIETFSNREPDVKLKAASAYIDEIKSKFPDIPSALIHGRMKSAEKEAVMLDFAAGRYSILVSTTVIEVGVNVPNASLMIVENAEYFGLSQLHQLRGRVGRGSRKSYCILVSGKPKGTVGRLSMLEKSSDGYAIAEYDLAERGPGDLLALGSTGVRQSGGSSVKMSLVHSDITLMNAAFDAADKTLSGEFSDTDINKIKEICEKTLDKRLYTNV